MAENSAIEWTKNTFNSWIGCAHKILQDGVPHEGCENCYAENMMGAGGGYKKALWGLDGTRTVTSEEYWKGPGDWNAEAAAAGVQYPVFCASLCDIFEDWQGPMIRMVKGQPVILGKSFRASSGPGDRLTMGDVRARLFRLIDATPNLIWQLLTKRPENVRKMWCRRACYRDDCPYKPWAGAPYMDDGFVPPKCICSQRENVWIGTSVSNQPSANELLPHLVRLRDLCDATFVSYEPATGPVDFGAWLGIPEPLIDQIICGGESGPRPIHPAWARSARDQAKAAGIAFFFKQWGDYAIHEIGDGGACVPPIPADRQWKGLKRWSDEAREFVSVPGGTSVREVFTPGAVLAFPVGKKKTGATLDGREWKEFPKPCVV